MTEPLSEKISLPFVKKKQSAALGHMLRDDLFFNQCRIIVQPDWFGDPRTSKVWRAAIQFHSELGRKPTKVELKAYRELIRMETTEKHELQNWVDTVWLQADEIGLDIIRPDLTTWYHSRLYKEGYEKSKHKYDNEQFQEAFAIMRESVQAIGRSSFESDEAVTFDEGKFLSQAAQSYQTGLTTGFDLLDASMSHDGTPLGPLYKGDTTVLLAPSNIGKTSTMITISVANILKKKHVLFMTHEGRCDDIREKMLCSALNVDKSTLFRMYDDLDKGRTLIQTMSKFLDRYLTYIPYNRGGMQVEEVINVIKTRNEQLKTRYGHGFDLIVDDYPAKLSTERAKGGALAKRNLDAIIYDYFVQTALELNTHCLVAIQTNRQGSRDHKEGERLLTMEDVSESWDVMTIATNVITLNRDAQARANRRMTFYVAKSRSNDTGRAVVARTNFPACRTHGTKLGGTWYRGEDTLSNQIDSFLQAREGQEITAEDIRKASTESED
jgi:replicative DNA helicase